MLTPSEKSLKAAQTIKRFNEIAKNCEPEDIVDAYFYIQDIDNLGDGMFKFYITNLETNSKGTIKVDISRSNIRLFAPGYYFYAQLLQPLFQGLCYVVQAYAYNSDVLCLKHNWDQALHGEARTAMVNKPRNTLHWFEAASSDYKGKASFVRQTNKLSKGR